MILMDIPLPRDCDDCPCLYMVRYGDLAGELICNAMERRDPSHDKRRYLVELQDGRRPEGCPIRIGIV